MDKFVTFIMTAVMTFLTTVFLLPSIIRFTETATRTDTYQVGLLFGAILAIGWTYVILYLWKD